ncbi:MAG: hypothetical protein A3F67_07080 [Verrucomicrobia bacterium RIFCSPHIGHO2_12_FULL_41_10]|nr:MAG: hypothetical protein A3F67_07080 [Verrucomicrobia bacterium RIFCSPHIGHO2_12_FULL_41_10]HLB34363.1 hypothetical protein [Chthoniobacterales bacterium]
MTFKTTNSFLLAISLSFSTSHLLAAITPENSLHQLQSYIILNEDNRLPFVLFNQEEIEDQENLVAPSILDPALMMDPASTEEVEKVLKEKIFDKEASSEVQNPVDAFHEAVTRKAARADEDIIHIGQAQEKVEKAAAARTGFVERVKNDAKNRSAFIEELQKIWTSDIISTSSEIAIKLVADKRYEALNADLSAINAKANAYKRNFDTELKAYKMTETAWSETVIACERAELVIVNNNQALEEITLLHEIAAVRTSAWTAHIAWVQAREKKETIKNTDHLTEEEAIAIEIGWGETIRAAQAVLEKLKKIDLTSLRTAEEQEINTLLAEAQAEQQFWEAKVKEIQRLKAQRTQEASKDGKQTRENILLQKIKRNKEMVNRKAREAIWSEQNQRIYETWELPGEIPNFSFPSFDQGVEEKISEKIEPPEILNEELEEKGRQLLRSERAAEKARKGTQSISISTISSDSLIEPNSRNIIEITSTDFVNHEEELKASIMAESLKKTPENRCRWEARKKVDQLIIEAAEQVIKDRALRMAQADETEEATGNDEVMSRASRVTRSLSNFGSSLNSSTGIWKPKAVSVLGSVKESEHAMALATKVVQNQKAADKKTQSDLEQANQKVEDAKKEWKEMILNSEKGAETRRIANGGVFPHSSLDPSLLLEFWEKADRQVLQEVRKQEKIAKEEQIAKKLQEQWTLNTIRWKARAEADSREREANNAEEKSDKLLEEKLLMDAKPGITEKKKQGANDAAVAAKADAEKARTIVTKAQEEWLQLVYDHYGIIPDDQRNSLQQADQAVNNLWIEVSTLYDETERHENDFLLQEQREKEAAQYSITLVAKRETDIAKCFKGVQQAQQAAKKQYDNSTSPNSRAEAQRLYKEVNRLELSAREAYVQIVETNALTDARKRTPGAMEAWLRRVTDSEEKKNKEANSVVFKVPCKDDSWTNETKRSLERLGAIEAADKKAFKIFQDEETRLNDIATIWTAIIRLLSKLDIIKIR